MDLQRIGDFLLEEMGRLTAPGMTAEEQRAECARARALEGLAAQANAVASNQIEVTKLVVATRGRLDEVTDRTVDRLIGPPDGSSGTGGGASSGPAPRS